MYVDSASFQEYRDDYQRYQVSFLLRQRKYSGIRRLYLQGWKERAMAFASSPLPVGRHRTGARAIQTKRARHVQQCRPQRTRVVVMCGESLPTFKIANEASNAAWVAGYKSYLARR